MSVCLHKRIQSVNCVISCLDCGAKLPSDFVPGRNAPKTEEAAEVAAEQPKEAPKETKKRTTKKGAK